MFARSGASLGTQAKAVQRVPLRSVDKVTLSKKHHENRSTDLPVVSTLWEAFLGCLVSQILGVSDSVMPSACLAVQLRMASTRL